MIETYLKLTCLCGTVVELNRDTANSYVPPEGVCSKCGAIYSYEYSLTRGYELVRIPANQETK